MKQYEMRKCSAISHSFGKMFEDNVCGSNWSISAKHELSNKRRLESIKEKEFEVKNTQRIIKEALKISKNQSGLNKKINFDSENEEHAPETVAQCNYKKKIKHRPKAKAETLFDHSSDEDDSAIELSHDTATPVRDHEKDTRLKKKAIGTLFDDDSDCSTENVNEFKFKKQFEGEAGQKLLQLQGRFGNDKRFMIDENFMDNSDVDEDNSNSSIGEDNKLEQVNNEDNEKAKNYDILQTVLGYEISATKQNTKNAKKTGYTEMFRYDPTREDAVQLEVPKRAPEDDSEKVERKTKKKNPVEPEPDPDVPIVSKERFYEVTSSLAERFASKDNESKTFSLGSMFQMSEHVMDKQNGVAALLNGPNHKTRKNWDHNPFKYDSSEDEEEEVDKGTAKPTDCEETSSLPPSTSGGLMSKPRRETFFFLNDDVRLKEGIEFFRRRFDEQTIIKKWELNLQPLRKVIQTLGRRSIKKKLKKSIGSAPKPIKGKKNRFKKTNKNKVKK